MRKIGLTGGIASGKSVAEARFHDKFGAAVMDADQVAHEVLALTDVIAELTALFGEEILHPDGQIDRQRLGRHVFGDASKLDQLNAAMHPRIGDRIKQQMMKWEKQGHEVGIVSAALLLETGSHKNYDQLVIILAPKELQIKRLVEDRNMGLDEAESRIKSQFSNDERIKFNQYFKIWNDDDLATFHARIDAVWPQLLG